MKKIIAFLMVAGLVCVTNAAIAEEIEMDMPMGQDVQAVEVQPEEVSQAMEDLESVDEAEAEDMANDEDVVGADEGIEEDMEEDVESTEDSDEIVE